MDPLIYISVDGSSSHEMLIWIVVRSILMPLRISYPIMIIYWNCMGAGSEDFHYALQDIIPTHNPSILILVETKIPSGRLDKFFKANKFYCMICFEAQEFAGGIWVL